MAFPKLIITEIDGIWTDGGIIVDEEEKISKKFNSSDYIGLEFCKLLKTPVVGITRTHDNITEIWSKKTGFSHFYSNVSDKLKLIDSLRIKLNLKWSDTAFIGRDIDDVELLEKVEYSGAVSTSPYYVKQISTHLISVNGGNGAFREFIEVILHENNMMADVIKKLKL